MTLLGIGYGNTRTFDAFLEQLRARRVETLMDVRAVPHSPGRPWLSRLALNRALTENPVEFADGTVRPILYVFSGVALGNPHRKQPDGLERFERSLDFELTRASTVDALRCGEGRRVALLCGCAREPLCHRGVLLRFAQKNGMEVEFDG